MVTQFRLSAQIALHPQSSNSPTRFCTVYVVEFFPPRVAKLAGPHCGERKETKGQSGDRSGIAFFSVAEHVPEHFKVGDRRLSPFH
jgi:hypothetical protein